MDGYTYTHMKQILKVVNVHSCKIPPLLLYLVIKLTDSNITAASHFTIHPQTQTEFGDGSTISETSCLYLSSLPSDPRLLIIPI